jgi:chromate transporter
MSLLLELTATAFVLSMLAVGGAIAIVPELFRVVVENRQWLGATQFNELFAISQAVPGPSVMMLGLVGWKVGGLPGGVLAMAAFVVPSSIIAVFTFRRMRHALSPELSLKVRAALAPISVALVASSGVLIGRNLEGGAVALGIGVGAAALLAATRLHPIVPLAGGAVLGALLL